MRKKVGLLVVAALTGLALSLALGGVTAVAGTTTGGVSAVDPQTANVPYVAWDGEQIRLVKCAAGVEGDGRFVIEDWSGNPFFKPQFENNGVFGTDGTAFAFDGTGEQAGRTCWAIDVVSQKPGLAVIKLVVDPGANTGTPVLKHQFLAIWMDIASATAAELDLPGVGDPGATGAFRPLPQADGSNAFQRGLVGVRVTGSFPLGNNFAGMMAGDRATLPDDWAALAGKLAFDNTSAAPGDAAARWDIHDSQSWDPLQALDGPGNHSAASGCGVSATFDTVDDCAIVSEGGLAGGELGPFSNLYQQSSFTTIGPFDPLRPLDTLLSDGLLNAGDAPMPAARIDVSLTGTAGSLETADKDAIYNRGLAFPAGEPSHDDSLVPHDLYAPFYESYIPATAADPVNGGELGTSSGIDGPSSGNNFTGFLNSNPYDFWDTIVQTSREGFNACNDVLGSPIPLPTGADHVVVYTDEHGEAIVAYNPNVGFQLAPDANNRCFEITRPSAFASTITVQANYPYQPPFNAPRPAATTIGKTVATLSSKTLSCVAKGPNEMFCVETVLDFEGNPIPGARIEFSRTPLGNIQHDSVLFGGFDTRGQVVESETENRVVIRTNALGQAGVVVTESLPGQCVDVKADNLGTSFGGNPGIKVFALTTPASGTVGCAGSGGGGGGTTATTATTGTTATTTTTTSTPSGGSNNGNSNQGSTPSGQNAQGSNVTIGGNTSPSKVAKVQKGTLAYVRVVYKAHVGRSLVLRVNGPAKMAKVKIVLKAKNGQVLKTAVRFVQTNKAAKVANLRLPALAKNISVSVL